MTLFEKLFIRQLISVLLLRISVILLLICVILLPFSVILLLISVILLHVSVMHYLFLDVRSFLIAKKV